jgi:serine O-acetyltransferase
MPRDDAGHFLSSAHEAPHEPVPSPRSAWGRLLEDIDSVFKRDPAARNRLELLTIYPGIQALLLYRVAHRLWLRNWRYAARWISFFARWLTNIDIHPGATIGRRFFIDHGAGVVIGETAEIGDDVMLYHGVTLGGTTWTTGKRHPTLGNNVVVGAGAKILGPIRIGEGARVATNSVVIADVPAHMTVVGIPGRIVVPKRKRADTFGPGVDLDHHLIPDPVGKALATLRERIDELERELLQLRQETFPVRAHARAAQAQPHAARPERLS